jgi:hypothetical protein
MPERHALLATTGSSAALTFAMPRRSGTTSSILREQRLHFCDEPAVGELPTVRRSP